MFSFVLQQDLTPLDQARNYLTFGVAEREERKQEIMTKLLDHGPGKQKRDEVRKVFFVKLCTTNTVACCLGIFLLL